MQSGVKRAVLNLQGIFRSRAQRLADSMPMLRTPLKRAENQHVESPLQNFDPVSIRLPFGHWSLADSLPEKNTFLEDSLPEGTGVAVTSVTLAIHRVWNL